MSLRYGAPQALFRPPKLARLFQFVGFVAEGFDDDLDVWLNVVRQLASKAFHVRGDGAEFVPRKGW